MLSAKGLYEWKLTDKDGRVIQEGKQWNMITDWFFDMMAAALSPYVGEWRDVGIRIVLSDGVKNPGVDYREFGVSGILFNVIAQGDERSYIDDVLQKKWTDYNFPPPVGSPRTIATIGVGTPDWHIYNGGRGNFFSFIELSTPITQNTDQYLYVKYSIYTYYQSGGMNIPSNRYIEYYMNQGMMRGVHHRFGQNGQYLYLNLMFGISPFRSPGDVNLVQRQVATRFTNSYSEITEIGARLAKRVESPLSVTSIPGVIGATVNSFTAYGYGGLTMALCAGYSPTLNYQYPTVSRVFVHPESRISQIFSDPSYPPSSNGSIAISNYPSWTKAPVIGRVKITKTGDATSIIDGEVFLDTAVDTVDNKITVAQSWPNGSRIRISEIPAP